MFNDDSYARRGDMIFFLELIGKWGSDYVEFVTKAATANPGVLTLLPMKQTNDFLGRLKEGFLCRGMCSIPATPTDRKKAEQLLAFSDLPLSVSPIGEIIEQVLKQQQEIETFLKPFYS